jgi:tRNA pseudouridine55 synthase
MFYLVNKHSWITSFWVLHILRKKLGIKKIGHTWTLDPLATGLLLVATGNSTKLIPYLEKKVKTYEFAFNLDWISPTWDMEWEIEKIDEKILKERKLEITEEKIRELLKVKFSWKITQIPPKYSAIKIDWKKAYDMIRSGQEFEMKTREIEILEWKLISYNFPEIKIEMTVSAWAYIRTIAEDIWKELWLWGYITYLHRTKIWTIWEELSKEMNLIEKNDYLDEGMLFPEFWKTEVNEKEMEDIMMWKEISKEWLIEWKKYLVTFEWINKSLVESRDWKLIVIRNWL